MSYRYVLRRVVQAVPALATILVVTFLLVHFSPGDPVSVIAGDDLGPGAQVLLRHQLGLDRPLWTQFLTYVGDVLRGDLGTGYISQSPVAHEIRQYLPATLLLMVSALVLASAGGVVLGTLAARRPFRHFDLGVSTVALVGYAIPIFWLAQFAQVVLVLHLRLFPLLGLTDPHFQRTGMARNLDVAYHLVLPAAVLAASELALLTRITRTGVLQESGRAYVRTARAKGVKEKAILRDHALRNALLPVITIIGSRIGFLFSGAVLVEYAFSWPGMGFLLVRAMQSGDRPVALGIVLLIAFTVVVANLLTDLLYGWADPRIRYG